MKYMLMALSILLGRRKKEKKKTLLKQNGKSLKNAVMIGSHMTQVWHSEVEGCKTVQQVFRKGKGGLQAKSIMAQSVTWL